MIDTSKLETNTQTIERLTAENTEASRMLGEASVRENDLRTKLEKASELEAKVKVLMELLSFFRCETCNGTGLFTFECPGCLTGEGECTCANEQPSPCPQCQVIPDIKVKYDALEKFISETGGEK